MNLGSIIFIIIGFAIILKNANNFKKLYIEMYSFMVLTKLFINVGYFLKIRNTEILYDEILTMIVFLLAIVGLFVYGINKKALYLLVFLVISMSISLMLNYFYYEDIYGISFDDSWDAFFYTKDYLFNRGMLSLLKPSTRSFLMLTRVMMCLVSFGVFIKIADYNTYHKILIKIYRVAKIILIFALIEFILKNIFQSSYLNDLYLQIFGESAATKMGLGARVGSIYAIICLYREQSILALNFSVVAIMLLFLYKSDRNKKVLIVSILLMITSIISMSFTALLFVVTYTIFFIYVLEIKFNKITGFIFFSILIIFGVIIVLYVQSNELYMRRISNSISMLFNYNVNMSVSITSENIRLYSVMYNLNLFFKYFLFGIGIGISYCYSGFVSSLISIGSVGMIIYFILVKKYIEIFSKEKLKYFSVIVICITLFFIGGVEFLYSELWLMLYLLDSCYKNKSIVDVQ